MNARNLNSNELSLIAAVSKYFPQWVDSVSVENGQVVVHPTLKIRDDVYPLLYTICKSSLFRFNALNDCFGVDLLNYPSFFSSNKHANVRFEVHYFLVSILHRLRLRIVNGLSSNYSETASLVSLFPSANWLEREIWDMYGINFSNHVDLRRILTDYGFVGFPLRKEFPLTGYVEVRYSEKKKRVILKPVTLSQEYRRFEFATPWDRFYLK
jgi:NADH-quinone oxidoreductase subunit C